ncbi:MAG: NirA family protein, partial [Devosia sp.]
RLDLDSPVNIHLTGCHHSCAQHYIGDIGLLAVKINTDDDGEPTEGFSIYVGGGSGPDARIGRELWPNVESRRCPQAVERLLATYLAHRAGPGETFLDFTGRQEIAGLKALCGETAP